MLRPCVISISGYDSSSGAGFSSDLKSFEASQVYGFSAMTAFTFQNEFQISSIKWVEVDLILQQIELQFVNNVINYAKIGLCQSLTVVSQIIKFLVKLNPEIQIIWDPILKSSSGYDFNIAPTNKLVSELTKYIFLITPNIEEYTKFGSKQFIEKSLSNKCSILLKGGHAQSNAVDILYTPKQEIRYHSLRLQKKYDKHGTGCVLSAVITTQLALGKSLESSCRIAKKYVRTFMQSSEKLLGYHDFT